MEQQASSEWRVNTLDPEAHVCFLYETEDQLLTILASFIREGLEKNEKIIYIADATSSEIPLEGFCSESPDLGASLKTGQLTILKAEDVYLRSGVFDPAEMITLLKGYTEGALTAGYAGLRVTGAATWALRDLPGTDRLIEYEARFNDFLSGSRCLALCQYPLKRFPASLLLDVLRTHPQIIIGTEVHDNPHYVPPSIFLGTDRSASDLRRWMADIGHRKATDAALRASEAYFREITENASDMILIVNYEGTLSYVSPSIERFMGYRPEELIGRSVFDFIHPADLHRAMTDFAGAVQAQETAIPNSFRVLHRDGSVRILEGLGKNLPDNPAIAGFIMNVQDVTERVSAEQAAREADEALRMAARNWQTTFDAMLDPVVILQPDGTIRQCNQAFADFVGQEAASVVGKKCFQLVHRTDGHIQGCPLLRSLESKDREVMPLSIGSEGFLVVTDPVKGFNGEITGLVHIMRNITEHERVEAALTEEKEFADAIIQSLPGAFYLLDETMRFLRWNTNFRRVMEYYSDEEVSSMSPLDFLRDEEKKKVAKAARQAFQQGESSVEAHIVNKDGTSAPYLFSGRVFTLHDKRYLAGMGIDISQRKEMEKALRESEKRFRNLYDEAPVGYFEYDLQGNITQVNRTELEMLGYTADEMIGQPCWKFIVEDARGQILEKLAGTRPPAHGLERTYRRKDGTTFPVLFEDRLLTDENGHVTGIRTTIQDITERKRSEEALRERDNLLKKLSIHVPGMIYQFMRRPDGTYCVPFASEAVKDIFGCSPEDVKEDFSPIERAILPEDLDRLMESVKSSAEHMTVWRREYRVQLPGGPVRWIYGESSPEKLADGSIIWHGFNRDITERKQAEEEREKLNAQLIQAQKMESVGRLAGGVAHDFNNKLTVILGYTQMAMEGLRKSDPISANLQQVMKAGEHSVQIVRQLLAFARKQTIAPKVLDLNETIEGMLKMLRHLIGEDIDLAWEPDSHLWPVKMDPSQIDQILANLCVNARDAISGVGKVTIETENTILDETYDADRAGFVPGDFVMLGFSDNGCGMDKETLANAFEPFFTTKEVGKGTGLGLSTVYGIVKQNDGFVNIYSEPGKGTTFKLYLPRYSAGAEAKSEAFPTEIPRGRGETILVVEDETSVLRLARRTLEKLGYDVMTSANPVEAITLAQEHDGEIHLLLTDVVLPDMSGKELAGEISRIRPGIPTLYMSGYTANVIAHHGVLDEGVQFIGKPFSPDSLARKVREAIDSEK